MPPVSGAGELDPACALALVRGQPTPIRGRHALVIATGRGGINAALLIRADRGGPARIPQIHRPAVIRATAEILVNSLPEEVFEYLSDHRNALLWQPSLIEAVVEPPGPLVLGSRVAEIRKSMGHRLKVTHEVVAWEPNRRIGLRNVSRPVTLEQTWQLEPRDLGTAVSAEVHVEANSLARLGQPTLQRMLERELVSSLANLKDALEAHSDLFEALGNLEDET
jgi:uncharacterized protein YndB with AHSA1/START domain